MKNSQTLVSRRMALTALACFLLLMLAGSVFDYPISCALYNEQNPVAVIFAAFGEYPAVLGWTAAGTMLLAAHDKQRKVRGALQSIGGILLIAFGTLMACMMPTIYLSWPTAVVAGIGIAAAVLVILAVTRLCRNADPAAARRVALVIFLTILADMVIINLIKVPWGRARMRLVANDSRAYFMPWWQPGRELKDALVALGVASEEFKSFPSGHSANSSAMMLLAVLPWIKPEWMRHKNKLLAFGIAWACIVAFTRLIMGAHYLTDVTVGLGCGFLMFAVITRFLPSSRKATE